MSKVYVVFRENDLRESYHSNAPFLINLYEGECLVLEDTDPEQAKVIKKMLVDEEDAGNWEPITEAMAGYWKPPSIRSVGYKTLSFTCFRVPRRPPGCSSENLRLLFGCLPEQ